MYFFLELKCVDNSALGRQAVTLGRPPKVIQVYAQKHKKRRHGEMGKQIDRLTDKQMDKLIHWLNRKVDITKS